jgi:hypothetical protein
MKKLLFITSLFLVSGLLLYFIMKGTGGYDEPGDMKDIKDTVIVSMVDSVKLADWKSNAQYLRIKTEIGLRKSNGTINDQEKELLISTLDLNYAFSLNKKYNAVKTNFPSFPSALYNEMVAFQSKNKDLTTGIKELNAFLQLQNVEGSVNQFISGRYNVEKYNNLRNRIKEIPIGSLSANSLCIKMKSNYFQNLLNFQTDVQRVTDLISNTEKYPGSISLYEELRDWKDAPSVLKYPYYKAWFNNPNNQQFL